MKTKLFSMLTIGWFATELLAFAAYGGGAACRTNYAVTLKVSTEREAIHRDGPREVIVQVELEGRRPAAYQRTPINLAVVLDRSTSMTGAKIEKARQAAATLVDQLDTDDIFSLVAYDSKTEILIPAQKLISREDRERAKARIFALEPRGGTALYAALGVGAEQAKRFFDRERINRVILLSDGQANIGPSTTDELASFGRELRNRGLSVTTVGLGEDYNEDLMTAVAEAGNANYYYVQDVEKLPGIFAEELGAARTVLARSISIRIELPEGIRLQEILGHPEIRCEGRSAEIKLPEYFGADRRKFLARCTVDNVAEEKVKLADVVVNYEDAASKTQVNQSTVAMIRLTNDEKAAAASVLPEVAKEVAVVQNRLDKEAAVKLADSGRVKDAVNLLRNRAAQNAALPARQQLPMLEEENRKLEATAAELESRGQLGKSSRKQVQLENWQDKYQKRAPAN